MIFVDTSAWLALADGHDRRHASALAMVRRISQGEFGKMVTTNCVLVETVTLTRRTLGVDRAMEIAKEISDSKEVRVLWIEPAMHADGIRMMGDHRDKRWSVTDCTSFCVMRSLGIGSAFAFDDDFAQAGFERYS